MRIFKSNKIDQPLQSMYYISFINTSLADSIHSINTLKLSLVPLFKGRSHIKIHIYKLLNLEIMK